MRKSNTLCLIFAVVDDFCKHIKKPKRRGGPKPKVTTNQFIKMIVLRNFLGITSERSFLRFLNNLGLPQFRHIPHHSWFNRKSKELMPVLEQFRQYLLKELKAKSELVQIIDSTPIPIVRYKRGEFPLAKSFERASFGHCASLKEKYFGYKMHLLTTKDGVPTYFDLTEANLSDIKMLEELASYLKRAIILGDKGYQSFELKEKLLADCKYVIVPDKKNQIRQLNTQAEKQLLKKFRQRIEITISQLKDQFKVAKLQAKSLIGLATRIMSALTTITLAVAVNRRLGRKDFKIKELLM